MVPSTVFCLLLVTGFSLVLSDVTHQDIRDAILQIVNVVRATDSKLERHEYRDKVVGEQLKKGMVNIDKRIKMLDPLKGTVGRLDERLAAVETILMQKDERERIQLQKTYDTVLDIQKNLPLIVEQLKNDILNRISQTEPPAQISEPMMTKNDFENMETEVLSKLDKVTSTVGNMKNELLKIRDENQNIKDLSKKSSENMEKVKRQLDTSEQLLAKYENKLAEYNNKIPELLPVADDKEQDQWKDNFLRMLESQKSQVKEILSDVKTVRDTLSDIPHKPDISAAESTILQKLDEIKIDTKTLPEKTAELLRDPLTSLQEVEEANHNETLKNINGLFDITMGLAEGFSKSYEKIISEIQSLSKLEQVMVQTADSVLDTKRRVEYAVHQVVAEVSIQVKDSAKDVTQLVNERFDNFEMALLDEETGAISNLTAKIEEDIDQVWRQMGIMHQQISLSTDTLNKLQDQTDNYVNGTINVMDSIKGKVGHVTGKMAEVDENLNYLLGRLSLVTQEFNRIKSGLGDALNEIRDSFHAVQNKIKENKGNGPHKIASEEVIDTSK